MSRPKTPQQKKELDYSKQRRTHWDSQKAARKAIPASKRNARQVIRKRSSELLAAGVVHADQAPTANELAQIERLGRYQKYRVGETLGEHLKHVQRVAGSESKRRIFLSSGTPDFYHEPAYDLPYTNETNRQLISYLHFMMKINRHSSIEDKTEQAEVIQKCIEEDALLLHGLFADEPEWKPRLLAWSERVLKLHAARVRRTQ